MFPYGYVGCWAVYAVESVQLLYFPRMRGLSDRCPDKIVIPDVFPTDSWVVGMPLHQIPFLPFVSCGCVGCREIQATVR